MELNDVDEAFVDEVGGKGAGIVDENAYAEDVAGKVGGEGGGVLG